MHPGAPPRTIVSPTPSGIVATARGRGWALARAGWLALAVLSLGLFIAGIPAQLARLQIPCPASSCESGQLSPVTLQALGELGLSPRFYATYAVVLDVIFLVAYGAVAALIFRYGPPGRLTLTTALALLTFGGTFAGATGALAGAHPAWAPAVAALDALGSIAFTCFLFLFPDGRFIPRWTRWIGLVWVVQQSVAVLVPAAPLAVGDWPFPAQLAVVLGLLGAAIYAQVYRYRRVSDGAQRRQTRLVVLGIAVALITYPTIALGLALLNPTPATPAAALALLVGDALIYAAMLLIPAAIGVAMLRHHLFDVDLLINRALVYGTLTACVLALYGLLVGAFGAAFSSRGGPVVAGVAAAVAAVVAQPLRARLQRGANRLLYGQRDEPGAVLATLGQRLEATLAPDAVLPAVVETVARALKLPYAAITLADEEATTAAHYGTPSGTTLTLPLVYHQETVGRLLLSPRVGDGWTAADRRLLDTLAGQIGSATHAVRLYGELQRARERLVATREEERRRLRRDLHDGLGPQLASQTLTLAAASKLLRQDPATAEALLGAATTHAEEAIADIRRVVYALRPPALDDLGLIGALREGASRYEVGGLRVAIDAPMELPPLPAAVEVAAYRIAQEALTNVVRHAGAKRCLVQLAIDETARKLVITISDDGRGLPERYQAGVGLTSMRERAEELGGACQITSTAEDGTAVRAELPLTR